MAWLKISESPARKRAKKAGYESDLEYQNALHLTALGVTVVYEPANQKIHFLQPEKSRTYLPDFVLPNGILVECKGQFTLADRQKHVWIKQQHPELDIRFVLQNPNAKIRKGSNTTLAMWCEKHGFAWADKLIPKEWLPKPHKEKNNGNGKKKW